jgi:hypothetical protein
VVVVVVVMVVVVVVVAVVVVVVVVVVVGGVDWGDGGWRWVAVGGVQGPVLKGPARPQPPARSPRPSRAPVKSQGLISAPRASMQVATPPRSRCSAQWVWEKTSPLPTSCRPGAAAAQAAM